MKGNKRNAGFTLIELMIVTEIIGIIVAIAVPNYIRTRVQSNEAAAVANLRTMLDAQVSYHSANSTYAENFDSLTNATPPYLSGGNWEAPRNGYTYRIGGGSSTFSAQATPLEFGSTGWRGFFVDSSGIIRYQNGAEATEESSPLGS